MTHLVYTIKTKLRRRFGDLWDETVQQHEGGEVKTGQDKRSRGPRKR